MNDARWSSNADQSQLPCCRPHCLLVAGDMEVVIVLSNPSEFPPVTLQIIQAGPLRGSWGVGVSSSHSTLRWPSVLRAQANVQMCLAHCPSNTQLVPCNVCAAAKETSGCEPTRMHSEMAT